MTEDTLTLSIRVHDPKEKQDATMSACWAVVKVPRADISIPLDQFIEKHVKPALAQIKNIKLT